MASDTRATVDGSTTASTTLPTAPTAIVVPGLLIALVATVTTTVVAALALAIGVDLEIPDGGEAIPLSGIAVVTGVFSLVGVALAIGSLRWSARPAHRFVWTTVPLTVVSLVPPLASGGNAGTVVALVVLHLVPAAVVVPALARALRTTHA